MSGKPLGFKYVQPKGLKVREFIPLEVKRPWPWVNRVVDGHTWVTDHVQKISMPSPEEFLRFYNWSLMKVSGMPGQPWGTTTMKSVFTTACRFIGMEQVLMEKPSLGRITDAMVAWNERLYTELPSGVLQYFILGDDVAANSATFMEPAELIRYVGPYWEQLFAVGKRNDSELVFHSDGDIYEILGDLKDMGVTIVLAQGVGLMTNLVFRSEKSPAGLQIIEHDPGL